ncbi:hypothetical protein CLOM_g8324, partial [Closterium sp. NIES-68]
LAIRRATEGWSGVWSTADSGDWTQLGGFQAGDQADNQANFADSGRWGRSSAESHSAAGRSSGFPDGDTNHSQERRSPGKFHPLPPPPPIPPASSSHSASLSAHDASPSPALDPTSLMRVLVLSMAARTAIVAAAGSLKADAAGPSAASLESPDPSASSLKHPAPLPHQPAASLQHPDPFVPPQSLQKQQQQQQQQQEYGGRWGERRREDGWGTAGSGYSGLGFTSGLNGRETVTAGRGSKQQQAGLGMRASFEAPLATATGVRASFEVPQNTAVGVRASFESPQSTAMGVRAPLAQRMGGIGGRGSGRSGERNGREKEEWDFNDGNLTDGRGGWKADSEGDWEREGREGSRGERGGRSGQEEGEVWEERMKRQAGWAGEKAQWRGDGQPSGDYNDGRDRRVQGLGRMQGGGRDGGVWQSGNTPSDVRQESDGIEKEGQWRGDGGEGREAGEGGREEREPGASWPDGDSGGGRDGTYGGGLYRGGEYRGGDYTGGDVRRGEGGSEARRRASAGEERRGEISWEGKGEDRGEGNASERGWDGRMVAGGSDQESGESRGPVGEEEPWEFNALRQQQQQVMMGGQRGVQQEALGARGGAGSAGFDSRAVEAGEQNTRPGNTVRPSSSSPGSATSSSSNTSKSASSSNATTATPADPGTSLSMRERFNQYMAEGQTLLQEGRGGLQGRIEIGMAEAFLERATALFERACQLDPVSVVAVGQLGNALLAHGEVKLRTVQLLRAQSPLAGLLGAGGAGGAAGGAATAGEYSPAGSSGGGGSSSANSRALVAGVAMGAGSGGVLTLQQEQVAREAAAVMDRLADECEQLLVQAGRQYRQALSMDKRDARALFNWGLALCYRGQLVAEEAGDNEEYKALADRMFCAAIDKFEAMLSMTDRWHASALLNWALALRDRSRLRPLSSVSRLRLTQEALQLLRQAAKRDSPLSDGSPRDPTFAEVRNAMVLCEAEVAKLKETVGRGADGRGRGGRDIGGSRALRPGNDKNMSGW